ncbi:hypothetical protein M409DRAFT_26732 [Zasmidium cellare ATCC 36951]|uniref:BTB domain-containing protein n=1 Tax=Zasmidium cellare ATCC 36951 TaxID=1080233 RepID=A0A6A6C6R7_ZASCE|nr:uncharacterized protein M409DRAFT_26732 [Zasmidium cellare ATCC 36951]KAF2162877.1 hypothetical protein M409DRAFT_26732 [Zasmidium cellare ATCC 36951]
MSPFVVPKFVQSRTATLFEPPRTINLPLIFAIAMTRGKRGDDDGNGGSGTGTTACSNAQNQCLPTDMFVICGDRIWPVHRRVLIPSLFFRRHFKASRKSPKSPPIDGQVVSAVHAALCFMYKGDYDDEDYDLAEFEKAEDAYPILFNVYVHAVAVKLELAELEELAVTKFSKRAEVERGSPGFADAVREIYTECPETRLALKNKVVEVCQNHATELFGVGASVDSDSRIWYHKLHGVLNTVPEFRRDLLRATPPTTGGYTWSILSLQTAEISYLCPRYDETFVMWSVSVRQKKHCWCPYCGAQEEMVNLQKQEVKLK